MSRLAKLAQLVHDQTSAELKDVQTRLAKVRAQRTALLERPGCLVEDTASGSLGWQAQAIWSNSSDRALAGIDQAVRELEAEIDDLLAKTRATFTKVNGLETLAARSARKTAIKGAKRAEEAQEALVVLKDAARSQR